MKSEEYKYLENEKILNGLDRKQAYQEIIKLNQSQTDFKNLKKELKKKDTEINNLRKQIDRLQKQNFKNIIPQAEKKKTEIKNSNNQEATIKDINRVLSLLDAEKRIGLCDLTKTCALKTKKMRGILNFLSRNSMIKEESQGAKLIIVKNG